MSETLGSGGFLGFVFGRGDGYERMSNELDARAIYDLTFILFFKRYEWISVSPRSSCHIPPCACEPNEINHLVLQIFTSKGSAAVSL